METIRSNTLALSFISLFASGLSGCDAGVVDNPPAEPPAIDCGACSGTSTCDTATGNCVAARLSWEAPTTREDGSALTNLAGYRVYYGNSSRAYDQEIDVGNTTNHVFTSLAPGKYFFAVTAYDTNGAESEETVEEPTKTVE